MNRNQNYNTKNKDNKMGGRCCAPELDNYQIKLDKVEAQETERQQRKGLPSEKIAIKVSDINVKYSQSQLQEINKMVFAVAEYERKFKNSFRVNKEIMHSNRLPEPYYLPSLNMFYVGEWVFNEEFNENVPGGVGRLYEEGTISEGVFKTFLLDADEVEDMREQERKENESYESLYNRLEDEDRSINLTENRNRMVQRQEPSRIERLLKADRQKVVNDFNFVIKLNGAGRMSSSEQNGNDEVLLEGEFLEGLLNGKGTLKMTKSDEESQFDDFLKKKNSRRKPSKAGSSSSKSRMNVKKQGMVQNSYLSQNEQNIQKIERKTEYFYSGFWKNGIKHGKGVEKVQYIYRQKADQNQIIDEKNSSRNQRKTISSQSFRYEGSFFENSKHGKGNLIFIGTPRNENLVQKDIERMENQMVNQGQNIKADISKSTQLREYKENQIQKVLDTLSKEKFRAHHIKIRRERNLLFDSNFNVERNYRTIFSQSYIGDFKQGRMEGQGTYVWPNGKTYRGKWKDNKLSGKGEFYWPDGTYFQGEYQDDERNGEGIMIWSILKRYRGNWAYGMRHGYGESIEIMVQQAKMVIKGSIWDRDKVKTKLFEQAVPFQQFNYLERKFEDTLDGNATPRKKQKQEEESPAMSTIKSVLQHKASTLSNSISRFRQW